MRFIEWLSWLWESPVTLSVFITAVSVLVAVGLVAFCCREKTVYFAALCFVECTGFILLSVFEIAREKTIFCIALLGAVGSFIYVVLQICLAIWVWTEKRKKRRAAILRQVKYTLPDRDNSFVRTRLNTVLQVDVKAKNESEDEDGEERNFSMEHARKAFEKLRRAPLSRAERLQAQDAEMLFKAYLKKECWTSDDVRCINELFSYLLKISAKYSL